MEIPVIIIKFLIKWLLFPVKRCKLLKYKVYKCAKKERLANWVILRKKRREEKKIKKVIRRKIKVNPKRVIKNKIIYVIIGVYNKGLNFKSFILTKENLIF